MMSKSTAFMIFVCGAVAGMIVACRISKNRYEQILQEEIDSVKQTFSSKKDSGNENDISEVSEKIVEEGYVSSAEVQENEDAPYVIPPEEFGEFEGRYAVISLTYYADGVLTDENDEMIDDVDEIVGKESLRHFGEYEDDSVFVRNDKRRCDYEILRDLRRYSDVIKTRPHYLREEP